MHLNSLNSSHLCLSHTLSNARCISYVCTSIGHTRDTQTSIFPSYTFIRHRSLALSIVEIHQGHIPCCGSPGAHTSHPIKKSGMQRTYVSWFPQKHLHASRPWHTHKTSVIPFHKIRERSPSDTFNTINSHLMHLSRTRLTSCTRDLFVLQSQSTSNWTYATIALHYNKPLNSPEVLSLLTIYMPFSKFSVKCSNVPKAWPSKLWEFKAKSFFSNEDSLFNPHWPTDN